MQELVKPIIVCIDDESDGVELLKLILSQTGLEVFGFTTPTPGLEFIIENLERVAGVVCDYQMPEMTGLELRAAMLPDAKELPFILYTAYATREMLENSLDHKVAKILSKPSDDEALMAAFEEECRPRADLIEERFILRQTYLEETLDLMEELEPLILEMEDSPGNPDLVNSLFRIVHTIKGGSGTLEWAEYTKFLHNYEDLLAKIKSGAVIADQVVVSRLLKGFDYLKIIVAGIKKGQREEIDNQHWQNFFESEGSVQGDGAPGEKGPDAEGQKAKSKGVNLSKSEENIKVPTVILDEFMELSGEITVIRNTINKLVKSLSMELDGNSEIGILSEMLEEMHKINSAMQSKITEMRKVPLKHVYRSIPRTVRDLCTTLDKKIGLEVDGVKMKVDTKLAQLLSNSLVHIIRNSADHGIEMPDKRKLAGKKEEGTIRILSQETGEDVIIKVIDDGAGLNLERIKAKALEQELYSEAQLESMGRRRIQKIIMEAGFSTAETLSDISGRGVGMDMVRSSIEDAGGRIDIDSEEGKGTTFTFTLPIPRSVLIIDSILIQYGERKFNIPQDSIQRLLQLENDRKNMIKILQGAYVVDVQGELIHIVSLGEILDIDARVSLAQRLDDPEENVNLVVIRSDFGAYALFIDDILNTEEVVVKKLDDKVGNLGVYAGATFMGDGLIGLIVDPNKIAEKAEMVRTNDSHDDVEDQISEVSEGEEEKSVGEYLIVDITKDAKYCFEMDAIFRLEEFSPKDIKIVGGIETVIYRNQNIPLIDTAKELGHGCLSQKQDNLNRMAVISRSSDRFWAFQINSVDEIIQTSSQSDGLQEGAVSGRIVLGEKVHTVINVEKLISNYANIESQGEKSEPIVKASGF